MADISASFGVTLDEWQEEILRASMGERSDATWAAKRVGLSVPRQNGKSQLLVARALAGALLFGERKIVISAHEQDTARETFAKLVEIIDADANTALRARIAPRGVMQAINREQVKFKNGATIQFKARTGPGGRGFSSDCLMLDEAQRLKRPAWVSINSTMSAMHNPQVWLLGTPPTPEDEGETFASIRDAALSGHSTGLAYLEWSADPNDPEIARVYRDGKRRWTPEVERLCWESNPAWNIRINHEVVQGEFDSYSREEFSIDRWGIWPQDIGATRLISSDEWEATGVTTVPSGRPSLAVAFSRDGDRQAVAGSIKHDDGVHVELIGAHSGSTEAGVASLVSWLCEENDGAPRWRRYAWIALCGKAGASTVHKELRDRGVPEKAIKVLTLADYLAACSLFHEDIKAKTVTHSAIEGQKALDDSVAVCDRKFRGADGAWGWEPTTADGDETPIEAVSVAHWAARTTKREPGRRQVLL